ncbi:hypothetical protein AUP68_00737 [Ilyonectria robusta]
MDGISAATTVIAAVEAGIVVLKYAKGVADSDKERRRLESEVKSLAILMQMLQPLVDAAKQRNDGKSPGTKSLGDSGGLLEQVQFLLLTDLQTITLEIKKDTEALQSLPKRTRNLEQDTKELVSRSDAVLLEKVHLFFSPLNFFIAMGDILVTHEEDTCTSFIESTPVRSWIDGTTPRLWCTGIPGSGKTMQSAVLFRKLRAEFAETPDIGVAAIFCSYQDRENQTTPNFIGAVWRQLASEPALTDIVRGIYDEKSSNGGRPTLKDAIRVFEEVASSYTTIYVIVDAINELSYSGNDLLEHLTRCQNANLIVTSRQAPEAKYFTGFQKGEIKPDPEDVRKYTSSRIDSDSNLLWHVSRDETLRGKIISAIQERSKEMFLMARLLMDTLGTRQGRNIVRALESLPKDIDAIYSEFLDRISSSKMATYAKGLVDWVLCATRPLHINELQCALSLEPGDSCQEEKYLVNIDAIILACDGIITVDEGSSVVRFVHHTFQEHLASQPLRPLGQIHGDLAQACQTYLLFDEFPTGRCLDDDEMSLRLDSHPFLL